MARQRWQSERHFKAVQEEQAGSLSGADDDPGPAALQYLCTADEGISGADVDLMCRFRTPDSSRRRLWRIWKRELVDIVIGTHRVLSKDVECKDLGLLIIDEEQRFGVAHKEKIKKMKKRCGCADADSATPIPRTLHMSLIGIRDMSVLEEPPMDRMPIQTYVMEYDEEMIREAIERELARDGQVYYVFNRVNQIAEVAARIAGTGAGCRSGICPRSDE